MPELLWWLFGALAAAIAGGYLYKKDSEIWLKVLTITMIIAGAVVSLYILIFEFFLKQI